MINGLSLNTISYESMQVRKCLKAEPSQGYLTILVTTELKQVLKQWLDNNPLILTNVITYQAMRLCPEDILNLRAQVKTV